MFERTGFALCLALLLFGFSRTNAEDYAARFKELREKKADRAQIDALLDEWRAKSPNDPDAWITSANYYFNESIGTFISTDPHEKGDFALTDKKTGKKAGTILSKPGVAQTSRSASHLLEEASSKWPDRLDIWCGLSWMYQETGNFDDEYATLQKMVAYVRDHPTGLKWLKGEPIPEPADKFVPDKLHSYATYYGAKENADDDKRMLKIATLSAEQFPNHPYAFNDVAVYYSINKDYPKTREWLEKAHQADPKDALVLFNLGTVSEKMGDKTAAKKWYEESLKVESNEQYAQKTKQALKKLQKAK